MSIVTAIYEHLYENVCLFVCLCVSEGCWEVGLAIASPDICCMVASPVSPVVWDPVLGILVSVTYIVGLFCVVICPGVPHVFISCLLPLQFMSTYMYGSLCVSEGFVTVACLADGYPGVSVQRGR